MATTRPTAGREPRRPPSGAWVDAGRWLAWWEAEQWRRSSWEVQSAAGWQLAKVGRWMMREADDHR